MVHWRTRLKYAAERGYFSLRDRTDIQIPVRDELACLFNDLAIDTEPKQVERFRANPELKVKNLAFRTAVLNDKVDEAVRIFAFEERWLKR